jgi:hypothetical protein
MLYIICENSNQYSDTIKTICEQKLNIFDYELLDPRTHKLDSSFSTVLVLGKLPTSLKIDANKIFETKAPDSTLGAEDKKAIFAKFKEAVDFSRNNSFKKEILNTDIPRLADLQQFLEGFKGQVMELKMMDGRYLGIYPDGQKLPSKYSSEYHVSTILNLAKLQGIFNFTKLSVKDL